MFGYQGDAFLGHLTSSGTVANLEALWVARELHPALPIVFTGDAHYTHTRMCALLRIEALELAPTPHGHFDLQRSIGCWRRPESRGRVIALDATCSPLAPAELAWRGWR